MEKILPQPPHPKLRKKSRHLECMFQPTHWLHIFLVSKTVGHHFWPRLMAGLEIQQGRNTRRKNQGPS